MRVVAHRRAARAAADARGSHPPGRATAGTRQPRSKSRAASNVRPARSTGPNSRSIHFVLRGAEFDGLEGLPAPTSLRPTRRSSAATCRSPSVCEIRDRAATILRDAGYIAAVQVPEQRIDDGVVRFQVLMAHLTQVRVRGDATGAERMHRRLSEPAHQAAGVQPLRGRALSAAGRATCRATPSG